MSNLFKRLVIVGTGGSLIGYFNEEVKNTAIGGIRFGRAASTVFSIVMDYRKTLYSPHDPSEYLEIKSQVHQRSAEKLLDLCCVNKGAFIKVGQHLGSLEYLLPPEYVNTLKILHSKAPQSDLADVYDVIRHELKDEPSNLFIEFDEEPVGAASLAQVHRARLRCDGREVAVKVQHPLVLDHSRIDIRGMEILVHCVAKIFPDFKFIWLAEETKRNLPLELNFINEGYNAERVSKMFAHMPWLKVPSILWEYSTQKVLTMEYCPGGQVNDLNYIQTNGISEMEVSQHLGDLYSEMIFINGYVHCDPHPGNVMVRKTGGRTEIVLLDHGLYSTLNEKFRITYGKFWQSIFNADLANIQSYGEELGVGELYGLFACMVAMRSWKSISTGINAKKISAEEREEIKDDVSKFLPEISEVLSRVPREMLLIFKTNDLLRGIESSLKIRTSMMSFVRMSRCCIKAVYNQQRKSCSTSWCYFQTHLHESLERFKLSIYVLYLWAKRWYSFNSVSNVTIS